MIKVIKRNGEMVDFNKFKIESAILKAFTDVDKELQPKSLMIANKISKEIESYLTTNIGVEDIQNIIEDYLMDSNRKDVARAFVRYRYKRELSRELGKRNQGVVELLDGENEELHKENSNKNAMLISTQRDYMAGEVSKEIIKMTYPKHLIEAHESGMIHIHDMDYIACRMHNCGLINLEDMLQNGTVLNGIKIYRPKSFLVACNVATQIILAVSSSQLGGSTITLTHLAPFVRDSYNKYLSKYQRRGESQDKSIEYAIEDTKKEVKDGVQLLNHQINSMSSVNGQSPFSSIFMYLNETNEYKEELKMIIEEVLKQRIEGLPNEHGKPITIAFPKLLYVLEEDNFEEGTKYFELTKLALQCSSQRLVPDYISEKKMKELKDDNVFPCINKACA